MSKWTELGFECVDEGRPVYIKNGNPYTLVNKEGKDVMRSLSTLPQSLKNDLGLSETRIFEFEEWAKKAHKGQKSEVAEQKRKEKKDNADNQHPEMPDIPQDVQLKRNKQIAITLGFEETQNGLFVKDVEIKNARHSLYLDFRNSIKGSFYSYPINDGEEKFPNEQLKVMGQEDVMKYLATRDEEQTTLIPSKDVIVDTHPIPQAPKPQQDAVVEQVPIKNKMTTHNVPLKQDIDYFVYRGKAVLGKEGLMKLKAEHGISTDVLIEVDNHDYKRVRAIAWYELPNGKRVQAIDYCDWDINIEFKRLIIKGLKKGTLEKSDVIYVDGETFDLKPEAFIKIASLFMDKQEFALRTIIGKAKRRCWGELLGITTASKKELELMREQYDRIHGED